MNRNNLIVRKVEFRRQVVTNNQQHMEKIKDQVRGIVVFNATTLEALDEERRNIHERILEGIEKMKESKVFSDAEVKEVSQYSSQILHEMYLSARSTIINSIRETFKTTYIWKRK